MQKIWLCSILLIIILSSFSVIIHATTEINHYSYNIINTYPHDNKAFTQGLTYYDGSFYEGTGLRGESSLRRIELKNGEIKDIYNLPDKFFGEGITIYKDRIYQLTWHAGIGFIYDLDFNQIGEFKYNREGWGLTHNNKELIMSDGSNKLYFLDPETMETKKEIEITRNKQSVENINELEYINGKIFANIWQKDYIVIINPGNGQVTGILDLGDIIDPEQYDHKLNVLNGIAYDRKNDRIFVTGKLWPIIFEIEIGLLQ